MYKIETMTTFKERIRALTAAALREPCHVCGAKPGQPCNIVTAQPVPIEESAVHVTRAIQAVDRKDES